MFKWDSSSWIIREVVFATNAAVGLVRTTFTVFHAGVGSLVCGQFDSPFNRPAKLRNNWLAHLSKTAGFTDSLLDPTSLGSMRHASHSHAHIGYCTGSLQRRQRALLRPTALCMLGSSPEWDQSPWTPDTHIGTWMRRSDGSFPFWPCRPLTERMSWSFMTTSVTCLVVIDSQAG